MSVNSPAAVNSIPRTQPRMVLEFPEYCDAKPPPPSLHENVFRAQGFEEDPFIVQSRRALLEGRQAAEKAHEIALAILNDPTKTETARHAAARNAIQHAVAPAMEKLQIAIDKLSSKVSAMEEGLRGPPAPLGAVPMMAAMEVRSALAALKREDRRKVLIAAIASGDDAITGPALRAPPFVTGLDPVEQADLMHQWRNKARPHEAAQLAILQSVAEHIERGQKLLLSYGLGLTSPTLTQRADAAANRARAAGVAA